jgi:hypothetical protein
MPKVSIFSNFSAFFLLAASFFSLSSCKHDNEVGTMGIRFSALYHSSPLAFFQFYPTPDGDSISFQVLNFFVSDIKLINTDNEAVSVFADKAQLIDFNTGQPQIISLSDVPAGSYKSLRLGVGVSPALNAKTPSDFAASSPLGDVGNYWSVWDSYIFSRVEGRLDTSRTSDQTLAFLYHAGVDAMYIEETFIKTFDVVEGSTTPLNMTFQADELFYRTGREVDIRALNVSHTAAAGTPAFDVARSVILDIADALNLQ